MSAVIQLCVLGGRQDIAAPCIVNALIIMLYTALSVDKHTPLQSWMREPVSHVIPASAKRSANVGIM